MLESKVLQNYKKIAKTLPWVSLGLGLGGLFLSCAVFFMIIVRKKGELNLRDVCGFGILFVGGGVLMFLGFQCYKLKQIYSNYEQKKKDNIHELWWQRSLKFWWGMLALVATIVLFILFIFSERQLM